MNQLLGQIRHCELCADSLPLGPKPIIQVSESAKILIAGQAPGRRAHDTGIPFNDPSGDRLRDWLGVNKAQFYNPELFAIVPMGFCYPGTGKNGDLAPRRECSETWHRQLLEALANIELVLAIGQHSIVYHLPIHFKTLTEAVEHWQDFWPHLAPMPHPSPRNNRWLKKNPRFEQDMIPALRQRVRLLMG